MSKSASVAMAGGAVVAIGMVAVLALAVVWGGFAFQQLWNWFAPPFSPVRLSLGEAIGLSCLLSYVRGAQRKDKSSSEDDGAKTLLWAVTWPGVLLLVGYLAHLSMAGAGQ